MTSVSHPVHGKFLSLGIWFAQILVAIIFVASGLTKLFMPFQALAAMMKWPGDYPVAFVRSMGLVDLGGGLGMLLPSLTRIHPRLTVLAACCCVVLQMLAIGFHVIRGEMSVLPLNAVLLPLCLLVLWGRGTRLPISPRARTGP